MVTKKKKKIKVFDKVVLALNIIFAVALLLCYLAPGTNPRDFAIIAVLGFGYQVFILVNILFIVYWLIRYRVYALISALSILAGFTVLTSNFGFRFKNNKTGKESSEAIRMMAYNVHEFAGIDKYEGQPVQDQIIQIVKDKQPDIVNFEEFAVEKSDKGKTTDSIRKSLNYHFFKPYNITHNDSSGIAIFTKYPIIDTGSIPSPGFLNIKAIYADVKYNSKVLRIYCVHLSAVKMKEVDKRKYLSGSLNFEKSSLIESKLSAAFIMRSYQVAKIKEHASKCPYPYIIAGDFNDTPISFAVNELSDGLKNTFVEKGSGLGTTYYSTFPKLHIDYILVNPQFDVLNYQEVDKKLSDHKAIISDIKLNNYASAN